MTEAQRKRFYFPTWGRVAAKYDWRMEDGRLVCDLDALRNAVINNWQEQSAAEAMLNVLRYAHGFAAQEHRAVTPDHLRHACNFLAAKVTSSDDLTDQKLRRVICLFDLLRNPLDLRAIRRWENPEAQEKEDLVDAIGKLTNEGTIKAICRNSRYGATNWKDMPLPGLLWLRRTLLERGQSTRRSALRKDGRRYDISNAPF